jgi:hypothetical protein
MAKQKFRTTRRSDFSSGEGLHIVGQDPEKSLQRKLADFLRRHQ